MRPVSVNVPIVLSDRLDETLHLPAHRNRLARDAEEPDRVIGRLVFGVGSRLVTSEGAPYLDGVFKLTAVRQDRRWRHAFKRTDDLAKSAPPGRKSLWRLYGENGIRPRGHGDAGGRSARPGWDSTSRASPGRRLERRKALGGGKPPGRPGQATIGLGPPPAGLPWIWSDPAPYPVIRSPGLRALSDRVLAAVMIGEG